MHGYRLRRALDPCELYWHGRRRERKLQRASHPDAAVPAVVLFLVLDLPTDDSELEHPGDALPHELGHSVATERHGRRAPTVRRRRRHAVHPFPPRVEKPPLRALQLGTGARERLAAEPELGVQRRGFPDAGREVAVAHGDGERDVVCERRAVGAGEREEAEVRVLDGDAGVGYDEHRDECGDGDGEERRGEAAAAFGETAAGAGPAPAAVGLLAAGFQAVAVAGAVADSQSQTQSSQSMTAV